MSTATMGTALPLGELLYGCDGDGARVYGDDDVAYALPLLVFTLAMRPSTLPPAVQDAFLRGCALCGLTGAEDAAQIGKVIAGAYARRPIVAPLLAALDAWARAGLLDEAASDGDKERMRAFLGATEKTGALEALGTRGGGERPAGTIPAGPLARFTAAAPAKPPGRKR